MSVGGALSPVSQRPRQENNEPNFSFIDPFGQFEVKHRDEEALTLAFWREIGFEREKSANPANKVSEIAVGESRRECAAALTASLAKGLPHYCHSIAQSILTRNIEWSLADFM